MADNKREAHPRLNEQEYLVAAIAGVGLTLLIVAGFLAGSGLAEDIAGLELSNVALIGAAFIFVGVAMWMAWLRPWMNFDDLKTAYYTGHHDHDHHAHEDHDDHHDAKKNDDFVTLPVTDPSAAGITELRVASVPVMEAAGDEPSLAVTEIEATPPLAPSSDEPDDLKIIEGIGPKTEQALFAENITKFAQVAAMTPQELEDIVKNKHGVRIVGNTSTWPRQARIAAAGDRAALDELKKRVRKGYLYDDFTDIEGIGPVIQEALYEAGIRSYEDLASAPVEQVKAVVNDPKINPASWAKQAKLLADGHLSEFQEYQQQLRAGRE